VSPSRTETTEAIKSVPRLILGRNERTIINRRFNVNGKRLMASAVRAVLLYCSFMPKSRS